MISIYGIPITQVGHWLTERKRHASIESPTVDFYEKATALLEAGFQFQFTEINSGAVIFYIVKNGQIVCETKDACEPSPRLSYPRIFVEMVENFYKERFDDEKVD